jgi:hypothetical protein
MRGRYTAAIWLFAVLILALLAVGSRAPQPRETAPQKAARARLQRLAAEAAPLAEDGSLRPENGCLRDRATGLVYGRDANGEWMARKPGAQPGAAAATQVTPSCEAADPSAREYAFAALSRELRAAWARQRTSRLEPTTIVFVPAEPQRAFSWAHWQSLLAPELSASVDQLHRAAESAWEAMAGQWQRWEQVIANLKPSRSAPAEAEQAAQLPAVGQELAERQEHSVLVARNAGIAEIRSSESLDLAEREEQSVLLVR